MADFVPKAPKFTEGDMFMTPILMGNALAKAGKVEYDLALEEEKARREKAKQDRLDKAQAIKRTSERLSKINDEKFSTPIQSSYKLRPKYEEELNGLFEDASKSDSSIVHLALEGTLPDGSVPTQYQMQAAEPIRRRAIRLRQMAQFANDFSKFEKDLRNAELTGNIASGDALAWNQVLEDIKTGAIDVSYDSTFDASVFKKAKDWHKFVADTQKQLKDSADIALRPMISVDANGAIRYDTVKSGRKEYIDSVRQQLLGGFDGKENKDTTVLDKTLASFGYKPTPENRAWFVNQVNNTFNYEDIKSQFSYKPGAGQGSQESSYSREGRSESVGVDRTGRRVRYGSVRGKGKAGAAVASKTLETPMTFSSDAKVVNYPASLDVASMQKGKGVIIVESSYYPAKKKPGGGWDFLTVEDVESGADIDAFVPGFLASTNADLNIDLGSLDLSSPEARTALFDYAAANQLDDPNKEAKRKQLLQNANESSDAMSELRDLMRSSGDKNAQAKVRLNALILEKAINDPGEWRRLMGADAPLKIIPKTSQEYNSNKEEYFQYYNIPQKRSSVGQAQPLRTPSPSQKSGTTGGGLAKYGPQTNKTE